MWFIQVSQSDLSHRKSRLVCQQTAVLSPAAATVVAITLLTIWARVRYSACARVVISCSSTPAIHACSVTCHPPGIWILNESYVIIAFKLDKLFTVLRDSSKCCQLSGANSSVSHIFTVTTCTTHPGMLPTWVLLSLSWLITVKPTPPLSLMSQYTLNGVTPPLPSGSMI